MQSIILVAVKNDHLTPLSHYISLLIADSKPDTYRESRKQVNQHTLEETVEPLQPKRVANHLRNEATWRVLIGKHNPLLLVCFVEHSFIYIAKILQSLVPAVNSEVTSTNQSGCDSRIGTHWILLWLWNFPHLINRHPPMCVPNQQHLT